MMWITVSFNYYLIGLFLKYIPGDIFQNTFVSGISELAAVLLSGILLEKFNAKVTLLSLFLISGISGLYLIQNENGGLLTSVTIMSCKFGISAAFNVVYIITAAMFKAKIAATAFGVCNFFARFATIMAPFVAEWPSPLPISILSTLCFIASLMVLWINNPIEYTDIGKEEFTPIT